MTTTIRPEQPSDYRQVETIHRLDCNNKVTM
jgi:predicted N-acetyltransferase YhbS